MMWVRLRRGLWLGAVALGLTAAGACGGSSGAGTASPASTSAPPTPVTLLDRLVAAYREPKVEPSAEAWADLLADPKAGEQPIVVLEFVRLRSETDARAAYDAYLEALSPAITGAGGEILSSNDTLMPGLEGLEGYEGGVSWLATFPSIQAYAGAMLDEHAVAAAPKRRDAVAEAQVLVGPNLVPDIIKQLPQAGPAADYPSVSATGKSAEQIVADLLAIYSSGGADPTKRTLEAMLAFAGFADQRVHFINLYRFNDAPGGGAAALGEYNAGALPVVLAHGGRPRVLVDVTHHLVGPVAWDRFIFVAWPSLAVFTDLRLDPTYVEAQKDRVTSAEQYGNLITIARADRRP